jgi:AcrR family transcriptional regulator
LSSASITDRPLRADARRNRERVLQAARETFAEHGLDAQMEDLARRAGVGVGTVYRHFPNKEAVVDALIGDYFDQLVTQAKDALEMDDPWEAFCAYMWAAADLLGANRGLSEITAGGQMRDAAERAGLFGPVNELISRAQHAGVMRPDVTGNDVPHIMCACGRVQVLGTGDEETAWRRHMTIMLDGLRAGAPSRLPG